MNCPQCQAEVFEVDVKCGNCGAALGATGAQRMIGQTVLGQYELVDVLGQGGMSVVFKARHKMTEQEVALKILPPELAAHSQVKSRFLDEAKALAALDHPNIVHLYNFGQENGSFVLAMQFVQGKTWERLILENKRLDWKASCRIAVDVLKALEYAHGRGVVHRDMKPSNVLVKQLDGSATVMDFGIAKMQQSTRLTATGQTMGTVRYMSPEQVRGQEVDFRTDLYSLGATLFESLTGDTPFDGSTHFEIMTKHLSQPPKRPSDRGVEVPVAVEDALMRSLAKKAEDRFDSAREMRKIIENALREGDVALVETQRLGRELLGDLKKDAPRAATAKSLADELEPGLSGIRPARKKDRFWLYAGLAVVAGAAAIGGIVLYKKQHAGGTASAGSGSAATEIAVPGVTLTPAVTVSGVHVAVATDGSVAAASVGEAYKTELAQLRAFAKQKLPQLQVADPVDQIVAVPQRALCEGSLYLGGTPPERCSQIASSIADARQSRMLVVVADEKRLGEAMHKGVADAVCTFQPVDEPDPAKKKARIEEICDMTTDFIKASLR